MSSDLIPMSPCGNERYEALSRTFLVGSLNQRYFILIDFKRELLASSDEHRGSPFCHQELALATYLEKRVLVFQEQGVRKFDGIIQFLQANAITFRNRADVPLLVRTAVLEENWNANWRDELTLSRLSDQHADELYPPHRPAGIAHSGYKQ